MTSPLHQFIEHMFACISGAVPGRAPSAPARGVNQLNADGVKTPRKRTFPETSRSYASVA
ncbi:hypothetical protein DSM43276_03502 [Mycobacteroides salmoniphilum]|nr:hypothetical protein DSM43276_03502 [Mycobacteroides salmoniphilum]